MSIYSNLPFKNLISFFSFQLLSTLTVLLQSQILYKFLFLIVLLLFVPSIFPMSFEVTCKIHSATHHMIRIGVCFLKKPCSNLALGNSLHSHPPCFPITHQHSSDCLQYLPLSLKCTVFWSHEFFLFTIAVI